MSGNKQKYRGYSYQQLYYVYASSFTQAQLLLRRQASAKIGKWDFTSFELFNTKTNQWEIIA